MTTLLNELSEKINQPKNLQIKLKDHQLTSIYYANQLETTGIVTKTINSSIYKFTVYTPNDYYWLPSEVRNTKNINYTIRTNFGIIADKVGAGKTYEIVGLLCNNLVPPDRNKIISSGVFSSLEYTDDGKCFKTNLILVPHNLITQWKQAFAKCNLKTYVIAKKTDVNFLVFPENVFKKNDNDDNNDDNLDDNLDDLEHISEVNTVEYYDVILCSATMFDDYLDKFKMVKYARIIIDEICSIKLPSDLNWNANFIWFITATPSGIKYLKRLYVKDIVTKMNNIIFDNVIIKNDDEYVSNSMQLPSLNQILIKCFTPKQFAMVREYVPADVMDMLNAGNVQEAILKLNCNVDTNENIMQVLTNKIMKEIHNKKAELTYQETLIPSDKKTHDEHINKIKDKIKSLEVKFESITQRLKDFAENSCPICLEDFADVIPGILPCCNQLYCIPCLAQVKNICPMCRIEFEMKNINVIDNNAKQKAKIDNTCNTKHEISKSDALIKLLKEKSNGKFLLFSNYDQTFENLNKKLTDEKITFSKVMGSGAVVNKTIERFTNGEIRVLMLNATNYGSGLNLQMATDIIIYHQLNLELETQVIGRAQRLGRTSELNVYYLLHDHEQNNVVNPSLTLDLSDGSDFTQFQNHLNGENNLNDNLEINTDETNIEETVIKVKTVKETKRTRKTSVTRKPKTDSENCENNTVRRKKTVKPVVEL